MAISVAIDFSQLKTVVEQCNLDEKLELLELLEKETFSIRFKKFLNQIKTDELSLEEITAEVEAVRLARYHSQ
ncbi:MAG: hypothetical protein LUQ68_08405 [Methylococcaceae bacterium]|nr:hypothetical protein [Methylococcaceae bacterium]OYV22067.1 MAG: hypothetical protein CG442_1566 [Methylococcaceae bacterium NSO1]